MKNCCDTCEAKGKCSFYEAGAEECVYEVLATAAKIPAKNEKKT